MNMRNIVVPLGLAILLYVAYDSLGWKGVAAVAGGILMWLLLHFTRLMTVMRRAAQRPMGYVGSAVMLNAKLKPKVNLMHVVALTRSLGIRQSEEGQDPEIYRWTDGTNSHVTCEFVNGRLVKWTLQRPPKPEAVAADSDAGAA
ncbi:MAG TPA: glycerate kinase [Comamonas sp.]|uniref:glycerate kinase n=1 Tax=Comamonas halotolerans TaxID=3041496 RepID=UPI0024E10F91|nr:glycerate kinase [Comamonas sp. NoAH]